MVKIIFICIALTAAVVWSSGWFFAPRRVRHRKNIKKAKKLLQMFRSWQGRHTAPKILVYLRKIDPFVFEEVVLTALKDQGAKITRNARYTADGGVDGRFRLNGTVWLVQAKRYCGAINAQHIIDFARVCNGSKGLFVHTGRTGKKSKSVTPHNLFVVSGKRLVDLIFGNLNIG
jgi:restriction system protein